MSVGILIITHNDFGEQLSAIAASILKQELSQVNLISVPVDLEPQLLGKYADQVRDSMVCQDRGQGVLVLTDIHGATPNNLARYFCTECNARVVSGVNLPMLLRVLNYSTQSLDLLCETAIAGGKAGVLQDTE